MGIHDDSRNRLPVISQGTEIFTWKFTTLPNRDGVVIKHKAGSDSVTIRYLDEEVHIPLSQARWTGEVLLQVIDLYAEAYDSDAHDDYARPDLDPRDRREPMAEPYYADDFVTLYHGDSLSIDEWWKGDVIVTDPPYGIGYETNTAKNRNATHHTLDNIHGDAAPFDPAHLLERGLPTVLFGANNYASRLPDSGDWIVWDKVTRNGLNMRISECELAWTRGVLGRTRAFRHLWAGGYRGSGRGTSYHPTQKPLVLMSWVIDLCPPGTIADPYAGSGSTLVAAKQLGRKAIGIEIEEQYCEVAAERLAQGVLIDLPAAGTVMEPQESLFQLDSP